MILVVAKCGASDFFRVLCDSTKLLVSVDEIKNLQCCLAGRHVKCGNVSIKHQQAMIYDLKP